MFKTKDRYHNSREYWADRFPRVPLTWKETLQPDGEFYAANAFIDGHLYADVQTDETGKFTSLVRHRFINGGKFAAFDAWYHAVEDVITKHAQWRTNLRNVEPGSLLSTMAWGMVRVTEIKPFVPSGLNYSTGAVVTTEEGTLGLPWNTEVSVIPPERYHMVRPGGFYGYALNDPYPMFDREWYTPYPYWRDR